MGGLAAGVAGGALAEGARQLARGQRPGLEQVLLTSGNLARVADRLAEMRGAAMKMGQILSMDAGDLLPPELADIFARLRADAAPMPPRQLGAVLDAEWGASWCGRFVDFDTRPLAAASIGQVHRARLRDGRDLAIKVQYTGVARSIDSDVDNVATLLRLSGLLPEELDAGPLLAEAKRQLRDEADYAKEAGHLRRFADLLAGDEAFRVPEVHTDLSTPCVLAIFFEPGEPLESLAQAPQATRDEVAGRLVDLALRELFDWGWMQTDPNLANYPGTAATSCSLTSAPRARCPDPLPIFTEASCARRWPATAPGPRRRSRPSARSTPACRLPCGRRPWHSSTSPRERCYTRAPSTSAGATSYPACATGT